MATKFWQPISALSCRNLNKKLSVRQTLRQHTHWTALVYDDTSPTTDSVTTVAENQKLAKASLAFNCKNPTFRKLFPEYVEKYKEQKLLLHPVQEQASSMPIQAKNSAPLLDDLNRVEPHKDMNNQRRTSLLTWLLLLLVSTFGV